MYELIFENVMNYCLFAPLGLELQFISSGINMNRPMAFSVTDSDLAKLFSMSLLQLKNIKYDYFKCKPFLGNYI